MDLLIDGLIADVKFCNSTERKKVFGELLVPRHRFAMEPEERDVIGNMLSGYILQDICEHCTTLIRSWDDPPETHNTIQITISTMKFICDYVLASSSGRRPSARAAGGGLVYPHPCLYKYSLEVAEYVYSTFVDLSMLSQHKEDFVLFACQECRLQPYLCVLWEYFYSFLLEYPVFSEECVAAVPATISSESVVHACQAIGVYFRDRLALKLLTVLFERVSDGKNQSLALRTQLLLYRGSIPPKE